jgi:hypothetical protein
MARPLCDTPLVFFVNRAYYATVNKSTDDLIQSFWIFKNSLFFSYWLVTVREFWTYVRPTLHEELGPMFNPNPAFLLLQKLKSAPRVCEMQNSPLRALLSNAGFACLFACLFPTSSVVQRWFRLSFCTPFFNELCCPTVVSLVFLHTFFNELWCPTLVSLVFWEDFQQFDLHENKLRNCLTTQLVACVCPFR